MEIFTETLLELDPVRDGIYLCSTKKRNCAVIGDRNEWRQSEKETANSGTLKNPLDDVDGFLRQACATKDSDLFNPTQATKRKHRFLPLLREKSMGMERNAYAWTFRGARCHLGRLYSQMGRLYAKKKVLENTST